jgi:hypothetical protein
MECVPAAWADFSSESAMMHRPVDRLLITCLLAGVLAAAERPAHGYSGNWVDSRQYGPFMCWAEFPLAGIEPVMLHLGQLQKDLAAHLGLRPPAEPIEVLLFGNKQNYTRYLRTHLPQVPYRPALYVKTDGPGRVYAFWSEEFADDLRHECTHALLHAALPAVPLWLDEGLAEYYELAPKKRAFDNPHLKSLAWPVRLGLVPKLGTLEANADMARFRGQDYRDSWSWVHFMLHGPPGAHAELVGYLRDLEAGRTPGELSRRLSWRIADLRGAYLEHFRNWQRPRARTAERGWLER